MIRNIVLDMGNVLLNYDPNIILDEVCSSDEEKAVIMKELFHGPEWHMGDRGDIKDKERYDLVKVRVPERFHPALKECADRWSICMKPIKGAREFCETIKSRGYKIYILSNASDLFYDYFPKFMPLDFFDGVFVSSNYHMLKPDVEIYTRFLKEFGLVASECLFIDDKDYNVSGAIKAGMNSIVFKGDYEEILKIKNEV